ncbi:MAG: Ig-like domain-containing protein [Bacteroidales bacterium]|nr:Ig-like domain-containing protein [Bacteroidales bacterium]
MKITKKLFETALLILAVLSLTGCKKDKIDSHGQEYVEVESVELNETSANLLPGGTLQLVATVLPDDATHKGVTWKSNQTSVATVSDKGLVTAKGLGQC